MGGKVMHDHEIISAAFQKYFSALKALDTFGKSGSFFDDVSSLDIIQTKHSPSHSFFARTGMHAAADKQINARWLDCTNRRASSST